MSSTRHAQDDSVFHQSRYASSPEFEQGLIANLVARRLTKVASAADRELIWSIQSWSHQPGGLPALAKDLIARFPQRLGTQTMVAIGKLDGDYSADEVRKIRRELLSCLRGEFPLKGETNREAAIIAFHRKKEAESARMLIENSDGASRDELLDARATLEASKRADDVVADEIAVANSHPGSYPVQVFRDACRRAAASGGWNRDETLNLENVLRQICLDAASSLDGGPWYFPELGKTLHDYWQQRIGQGSGLVATAVTEKVQEILEYTAGASILSLLTGRASLGQSYAARQWCEAHPGQARYVEVPPSNDEASFFRAIARAVGLGNFLNYKNVQIRERVEYVLQTGGLCLVLNRAENLWPQKNLREAFPGRLAWLFEQVQKGASACMISGPQFFMQQRTCEKTGWDSPEFRKKIDHIDRLPDSLSVEDMTAIAGAMLPEAGEQFQEAAAIYAVGQERDLAALEAIAKRAQFLAQRDGRTQRNKQDVMAALKFVSGSDTLLREAFNPAQKSQRRPALAPDHSADGAGMTVIRETKPTVTTPASAFRRAQSVELTGS